MDLKLGVWSVLNMMWKINNIFQSFDEFYFEDFEELVTFVFPTIMMNVKFTNDIHVLARHCQDWALNKTF
jgi:hypothetical protein